MKVQLTLLALCGHLLLESPSSKPKSWRDFDANKDGKLSAEEQANMDKAWGIKPSAKERSKPKGWLAAYAPKPPKEDTSHIIGPSCGINSTALKLPASKKRPPATQ